MDSVCEPNFYGFPVFEPMPQIYAFIYTTICSYGRIVGRRNWSGIHRVWHALPSQDKGRVNLSSYEEHSRRTVLLGHAKIESTVRYLGIEVDDALEMAEQTEV